MGYKLDCEELVDLGSKKGQEVPGKRNIMSGGQKQKGVWELIDLEW